MQQSLSWLGSAETIISERRSVRGFNGEALSGSQKALIKQALNTGRNPFRAAHRFDFVNTKLGKDGEKLGTYGIIRGASDYLISAMTLGPDHLEALGFDMEYAVLEAESLGLGSCWLGGTFNKGQFAKAMGLEKNEILPIVLPLGKPANKDGLMGRLIRSVAGSNDRKPFDQLFFDGDFTKGLSENEAGNALEALEAVRRAPSASNKQPWRVIKQGSRFDFYLEPTKGYSDRLGYDIQRIDLGIAVCHFDAIMMSKGINGEWQKKDDLSSSNPEAIYIISWEMNY